mgnify:CR=1 FL=1
MNNNEIRITNVHNESFAQPHNTANFVIPAQAGIQKSI